MTRADIQAIVIKHLTRAVEGLRPEDVDPTRSMKDVGANSLDVVEVVSASMRELKVKVPRAELGNIKNLDGLVDVLERAWIEKNGQATAG